MDGKIILLIVSIIALALVCFIHWLYTDPYDLRDWLVDEFALFYILGTMSLAGIVFGFIFWIWWIMLVILGSFLVSDHFI
ncbi:MAG: hypothetical protein ACOX6H_02855 [Christensenellales bacterium]|jgi:hypothetical protein